MSGRGRIPGLTRRDLLRCGLLGAGLGLGPGALWSRVAGALPREPEAGPTLVVVELTGGNDGLNTVVPFRHDAYYEARPRIAVPKEQVLRLDDEFGLHPRLAGLHNLWQEGRVAIVHGCGYPNPIRSHFEAMRWWHTGVPHGNEATGWVGRLADDRWPGGREQGIVDIGERASLAVQSRHQSPIVFSNPEQLTRRGDPAAAERVSALTGTRPDASREEHDTLAFLRQVARTAERSASQVQAAIADYETPTSYGLEAASLARDLRNVAALMAADFPARIYYVSMTGFDTHSVQNDTQPNLLMYVGDALEGFQRDLDRLGRADEVLTLVFTEFGRRVADNQSGGTDHGAAGPMWLVGKRVRGGLHGRFPSLTELDDGDLRMTTDFRQVYASVLRDWMGVSRPAPLLRGDFEPLSLLA